MPIFKCVEGCNIQHAFQDKRYGKRRRVFNRCKDPIAGIKKYRCTVCLKEFEKKGKTDGKA